MKKLNTCFDAAFAGTQPHQHRGQPRGQRRGVERHVQRVEPGDEARHVRALLLGRQRHVQVHSAVVACTAPATRNWIG